MRTKKEIVGGITVVLLLSSIVVNSIYINKYVKLVEEQEQYKLQIQKHQQEAKQLTEELSNKSEMIEGLQQQSNVGYIPNEYERKLLEMLVECEAGGESMQGKIAVVNVVLNRIKSADFPNSISKVIYQKNQFEPVVTGIIDSKTPSQDSIEAVKRAFMGEKVVDSDIVNFWASWLDSSNDLWNHIEIVTTIGVHHFGRGWE